MGHSTPDQLYGPPLHLSSSAAKSLNDRHAAHHSVPCKFTMRWSSENAYGTHSTNLCQLRSLPVNCRPHWQSSPALSPCAPTSERRWKGCHEGASSESGPCSVAQRQGCHCHFNMPTPNQFSLQLIGLQSSPDSNVPLSRQVDHVEAPAGGQIRSEVVE